MYAAYCLTVCNNHTCCDRPVLYNVVMAIGYKYESTLLFAYIMI